MGILQSIQQAFRQGNALTKLIYVNAGVFIGINVPVLIAYLLSREISLLQWVALPASWPEFLRHPWTLFTYMFVHTGVWHLLFNMLFLYWFGLLFLQWMNPRQLVNLYLLGGLTGGLLYLLFYHLFPVFQSSREVPRLIGASASAMAIMIATAMRAPDFTVRLFLVWEVKIKHIALLLILLDIFTIPQNNAGGHISHLGGAMAGFFFIILLKKGIDITGWMKAAEDGIINLFRPHRKMKVVYKRPLSDFEYNQQKTEESKRLDRILEKIKDKGYDSLSEEEKEFLFKQSRKM